MELLASSDGRPRVLIADDHRPLLERVATLLEREFQVIGTVSDGAQLVDAEASLHPDVMVVDISMPEMSGLEAARRIRSTGSHAVLVCLTAHTESDFIEAALDAGALGYVVKTSLWHDLVPATWAALQGRRFISSCLGHSETGKDERASGDERGSGEGVTLTPGRLPA